MPVLRALLSIQNVQSDGETIKRVTRKWTTQQLSATAGTGYIRTDKTADVCLEGIQGQLEVLARSPVPCSSEASMAIGDRPVVEADQPRKAAVEEMLGLGDSWALVLDSSAKLLDLIHENFPRVGSLLGGMPCSVSQEDLGHNAVVKQDTPEPQWDHHQQMQRRGPRRAGTLDLVTCIAQPVEVDHYCPAVLAS